MSGVTLLESHPSNKVPVSGLLEKQSRKQRNRRSTRFYTISRRRYRANQNLDNKVIDFKVNPCQETADELCKAMGIFHSAVEWEKSRIVEQGIK